MNEYPAQAIGSWQGLTIKEILEKVDLSNIINENQGAPGNFFQQSWFKKSLLNTCKGYLGFEQNYLAHLHNLMRISCL